MTKRFEYCVNEADCYRIADMTGCKTLEQFIEDVKKEHHEWYTEEEIKELAEEEYADYIYNHGLEGYEVIDKLNEQDQRIQELKKRIQEEQELNTDLCNFNLHNILDKKNKEINQLKKELQAWKDTAEALQDQLAHEIVEVLIDD